MLAAQGHKLRVRAKSKKEAMQLSEKAAELLHDGAVGSIWVDYTAKSKKEALELADKPRLGLQYTAKTAADALELSEKGGVSLYYTRRQPATGTSPSRRPRGWLAAARPPTASSEGGCCRASTRSTARWRRRGWAA